MVTGLLETGTYVVAVPSTFTSDRADRRRSGLAGGGAAGSRRGRSLAWHDLTPSVVQHTAPPLVCKCEGLTAAFAPFGQECVAIDDDAEFPVARPRHQGTARDMSHLPHRPKSTNVT